MFAAQQHFITNKMCSFSATQLKICLSDLRWEQVTLPQLIVQLHSLFKQWVFLLTQVRDLLADLLWVLSTAAAKKPVPLT